MRTARGTIFVRERTGFGMMRELEPEPEIADLGGDKSPAVIENSGAFSSVLIS
jgi:hypothetical protein